MIWPTLAPTSKHTHNAAQVRLQNPNFGWLTAAIDAFKPPGAIDRAMRTQTKWRHRTFSLYMLVLLCLWETVFSQKTDTLKVLVNGDKLR